MALRLIAIVLFTLNVSACATSEVKPWQRGDLARDEMQWEPGFAGEGVLRDHVFVSKEAASMGTTLGGGGCGCN